MEAAWLVFITWLVPHKRADAITKASTVAAPLQETRHTTRSYRLYSTPCPHIHMRVLEGKMFAFYTSQLELFVAAQRMASLPMYILLRVVLCVLYV